MDFPVNHIICGDNMEVMATFPDNCIPTIITDPPYGLGFMGKKWDTFKPENIALAMKKDKRAHSGIASQRRSNTAGSYDFARNTEFQQWFTIWGKEALRILKPGGTLLIFGGTRTYHRLACGLEDAGFILKDCIMWLYGSGFPKALDISKQLDKGHKREIIGDKSIGVDGGKRSPDTHLPHKETQHMGQWGFETSGYAQQVTSPVTPEAKLWNGWKSHGLKPAYEPILVAMKPNDGTYANNALKHGVSGLNIDGGRIGTTGARFNGRNVDSDIYGKYGTSKPKEDYDKGRYPANVILDEEAAAMLDEQSGERPAGGKVTGRQESCTGDTGIYGHYEPKENSPFCDSGGASRFFYCTKTSKSERNAGCKGLDFTRPADRNKDDGPGGDNPRNRTNTPKRNHHPTVKPLALMEYLCRLTKTPTGGIVLDPFAGSGTTCVACVNVGRDFIGIEKEFEYVEIARRRIKWAEEQIVEKMGLFVERGK